LQKRQPATPSWAVLALLKNQSSKFLHFEDGDEKIRTILENHEPPLNLNNRLLVRLHA
jgi:hypothetical protein